MNAKSFALGVFLALAIFFGGYFSYTTYLNAKAGAQAYIYLSQPVATGTDGKPVSRAQIIDAFIKQAQANSKSAGSPSPSDGKN